MSKLAQQMLGWSAKPEGWGKVYASPDVAAREPAHNNAFQALQRRLVRAGMIGWCEIGQCYRITVAGQAELRRLNLIWSANEGLGPVGEALALLVKGGGLETARSGAAGAMAPAAPRRQAA